MTSARIYDIDTLNISLDFLRKNSILSGKGCWEWSKSTISGYGYITRKDKKYRTHRISLILSQGQPSSVDLECCHSCNNKKCCNPEHLSWGTSQENMQQAVRDGLIKKTYFDKLSPEEKARHLLVKKYLQKYTPQMVAKILQIKLSKVRSIQANTMYGIPK